MFRKIGTLLFVIALDVFAQSSVVTENNNGQEVQMQEGECVVVELDSNPSTGYSWQIISSDKEVIDIIESKFISSNTGLCGAGGIQRMTVFAKHSGIAQLTGRYFRSWEKFNPKTDKSVSFKFVIVRKIQ